MTIRASAKRKLSYVMLRGDPSSLKERVRTILELRWPTGVLPRGEQTRIAEQLEQEGYTITRAYVSTIVRKLGWKSERRVNREPVKRNERARAADRIMVCSVCDEQLRAWGQCNCGRPECPEFTWTVSQQKSARHNMNTGSIKQGEYEPTCSRNHAVVRGKSLAQP